MRSDTFGCNRMHLGAFRCLPTLRRFFTIFAGFGVGGNVFGWLSGRGQSILGGFREGGNV